MTQEKDVKRFHALVRRRRAAIILSDKDHAAAMRDLTKLMKGDPKKNSARGKRLVRLAKAIERYEEKRWPIPAKP